MSVPDFALGTTFNFCFTTRQFTTGIPFTLAGSPAVSVKESANDTPITAGVTIDPDTCATPVVGLNEVQIVATGASGYEAGKSYAAYISAGTVDSVSVVGEVIYQFTIEKQSALRPTTAGRTLVVDTNGLADANTVAVGPTGAGTAQTATNLGGVIATVDTVVDAIKVQTDKLAFTVANQVDANVQYVNDIAVAGDGQPATPWKPA